MTWISVENELPKPFEVVWIYWRDREVLLGCRTYELEHYDPSEGWYQFEDEKCRWTHWWMPITGETLDEPNKPKEEAQNYVGIV